MRSKSMRLIPLFCMLLCMFLLVLGTAAYTTDESGTIHLTDAADVLTLMNDTTLWDKNIVLDATVDLSTYTGEFAQAPIGQKGVADFTGTFDGQNNEIQGIAIESDAQRVGLFGSVANAEIRNLTIRGSIKSSGDGVGGFVGTVLTNLTVDKCVNYCTVESTSISSTGSRAAGIVGVAQPAAGNAVVISNCKNYGAITGVSQPGGIMGRATVNGAGASVTIDNCYNAGKIVATAAASYAGGILGYTDPTVAGAVTISKCRNAGDVDALKHVGGIVGSMKTTVAGAIAIDECWNSGNIHAKNGYVAGIVGYPQPVTVNYGFAISDCGNTGTISSDDAKGYVGGIYGYHTATGGKAVNVTRCYNAGETTPASGAYTKAIAAVPRAAVFTDCYYTAGTTDANGTSVTLASTVAENAVSFAALDASELWTITVTGPELTTFHTHTAPNADGQCDTCGLQLTGCKHANTELRTVTPPTCVTTGTAQTYCLDCEEWIGDAVTLPIDLAKHTGTDYVWKQNTEGAYELTCAACGTVIKTQTELPTVYVDAGTMNSAALGFDTNDGLTAGTAVLTLEEAAKRLAEVGGTVVVCDRYTVTKSITLPEWKNTITFSGLLDSKGLATTGFYFSFDSEVDTYGRFTDNNVCLSLGGDTAFDGIVFKGDSPKTSSADGKDTILAVAGNWHNVDFDYVRIDSRAQVFFVAGAFLAKEDNAEVKNITVNLNGASISSGNPTGHVFYNTVVLGDWFGGNNLASSNKTVTLNTAKGKDHEAKISILFTMSTHAYNGRAANTTPNCESIVNLNGSTSVTKFRTGHTNVGLDAATAALDKLTVNFNDNSTIGDIAYFRNVKNTTVKVSTEAEGRETALTKAFAFEAYGSFATEGTVGQVNVAYGEHSFAASLSDPVYVRETDAALYAVTENVTPEHVWGEGEVTTAPGVGMVGEKTYTCTCGLTKTEEIAALKAALTKKSISAVTDKASGESTMRFIAALEVANGVTVKKIGTYISLVAIGEDGKPSTEGAKVAVKEQAVTDAAPATFAVDLTGIPADQAGTSVFAWAYAVLSDGTRVTVAFDAATVNALVSVQ